MLVSRDLNSKNTSNSQLLDLNKSLDVTKKNSEQLSPTLTTVFNDATTGMTDIKGEINEDLTLKDHHGFSAFDRAVHFGKAPLAKQIMLKKMANDYTAIKEACNRAEEVEKNNPAQQELVSVHQGENLKYVCAHGYAGHNNVLLASIRMFDFKKFIRIYMDADTQAWLSHQDPESKSTLLHEAIARGNEEVIYFLMMHGADQNIVDADLLSPRQAAEKSGGKDLVDLIDHINLIRGGKDEEVKSLPPEASIKLNWIVNSVESYVAEYKEVRAAFVDEKGTLTDQGKANKDFSTHGVAEHTQNSQGHHPLVLNSVIEGNLEKLAAYAKMGASLNSISIPFQRALEDPLGYEPYMRKVNENMKESIAETREWISGEDPTLWEREPGVGKSLLDMAVLYSGEGKEQLDIIAYLLGQGLDPLRTNDEGECPFSLALIKGNLQAASLMMHYKMISSGNVSGVVDDKLLERAFQLLQQGSKLRDPLYINTTKAMGALFAMPVLLGLVAGNNEWVATLGMMSFIFSFIMPDMTTYRETLTQKSAAMPYLPEVVKSLYPWIYKASTLEIAALPDFSYGSMGMSAMNIYFSTVSLFSSMKTAYDHIAERPLKSLYKVGAEALPLIQTCTRFKSLFSSLVLRPLSRMNVECEEIRVRDYKYLTISKKLDSKLDPKCVDHAKMILTDNWDQAAFEKDPAMYLRGVLETLPEAELVENPVYVEKVVQAYHTLNEPAGGLMKDTAIKMGIVWTATKAHLDIWPQIANASIFYLITSGIYRALRG